MKDHEIATLARRLTTAIFEFANHGDSAPSTALYRDLALKSLTNLSEQDVMLVQAFMSVLPGQPNRKGAVHAPRQH